MPATGGDGSTGGSDVSSDVAHFADSVSRSLDMEDIKATAQNLVAIRRKNSKLNRSNMTAGSLPPPPTSSGKVSGLRLARPKPVDTKRLSAPSPVRLSHNEKIFARAKQLPRPQPLAKSPVPLESYLSAANLAILQADKDDSISCQEAPRTPWDEEPDTDDVKPAQGVPETTTKEEKDEEEEAPGAVEARSESQPENSLRQAEGPIEAVTEKRQAEGPIEAVTGKRPDIQDRVQQLTSQELQRELEEMQRSCETLKKDFEREVSLRKQAEDRLKLEAETIKASVENGNARKLTEAQKALKAAELESEDKDKRLQSFADLIKELHALVAELQQRNVEQIQRFGEFVQSVRSFSNKERKSGDIQPVEELSTHLDGLEDLSKFLEKADQHKQELTGRSKHLEGEAATLRNDRDSLAQAKDEAVKQWDDEVARQQAKQQSRLQRHWHRNSPNIAEEMAAVLKGVSVSFVLPNGSLESCKLKVEFAPPSRQRIVWTGSKGKMKCGLDKINFIGYGFTSRAWAASKTKAAAEDCFTVYTAKYDFNFVCPGAHEIGAILPVLSRLCARSQGWQVPGSLCTRSQFLSARGWCKVQSSFRRAGGGNWCTYFLKALGCPQRHDSSVLRQRGLLLPSPASDTTPPDIWALGEDATEATSPLKITGQRLGQLSAAVMPTSVPSVPSSVTNAFASSSQAMSILGSYKAKKEKAVRVKEEPEIESYDAWDVEEDAEDVEESAGELKHRGPGKRLPAPSSSSFDEVSDPLDAELAEMTPVGTEFSDTMPQSEELTPAADSPWEASLPSREDSQELSPPFDKHQDTVEAADTSLTFSPSPTASETPLTPQALWDEEEGHSPHKWPDSDQQFPPSLDDDLISSSAMSPVSKPSSASQSASKKRFSVLGMVSPKATNAISRMSVSLRAFRGK